MIVRHAQASDREFLERMFAAAVWWREPAPAADAVAMFPQYFADWGRAGDVALIAIDDFPVGAAWFRFMRGYGFVADDVPELGIAVIPEARGRGVGRVLLEALQREATALSLSVHSDNPARRLYAAAGFVEVERSESAITMLWSAGKR